MASPGVIPKVSESDSKLAAEHDQWAIEFIDELQGKMANNEIEVMKFVGLRKLSDYKFSKLPDGLSLTWNSHSDPD